MRWRCLTHLPGYMLCWQISVLFYYAATFFPFQSKVWLRICRIWVTVAYWKLPAILPLLTFLLLQLGIECHFWLSALPSLWENQRLHVVDGTIIATAIKLAILWESNRAKLLLVKSQKTQRVKIISQIQLTVYQWSNSGTMDSTIPVSGVSQLIWSY